MLTCSKRREIASLNGCPPASPGIRGRVFAIISELMSSHVSMLSFTLGAGGVREWVRTHG
jgi:hypothetical protein